MNPHLPAQVRLIPESLNSPGLLKGGHLGRLGRHVEHDPRSRGFVHEEKLAEAVAPLVSRSWAFKGSILTQDIGSCTGEAQVNLLNCAPFVDRRGTLLTQDDALSLYEQATHLDNIPGCYPPNDTGSSGLAVSKAAKKRGLIAGYKHAFSLASLLHWLSNVGPAKLGIEWFAGFDTPIGVDAECRIDGVVRGGHEICVNEINVEKRKLRAIQSWGPDWGDAGRMTFSWDTMAILLSRQGDATLDHE
jgi:hypothetical protein